MLLDITDRRRMEETIRQSEERLRLTLEAANTVAWEIKTADGSLNEIGPVDRQFGGTGSAHATVADVVSGIHPADRDRVLGAVASAMRERANSGWSSGCPSQTAGRSGLRATEP